MTLQQKSVEKKNEFYIYCLFGWNICIFSMFIEKLEKNKPDF